MSVRKFGTVPLALWRMQTFKKLSENAKLATLFYWCGPHSTSAGTFRLPDAYAISDLELSAADWIAARTEVETASFILRDEESDEVLVTDYLNANRPTASNIKLVAAIKAQIGSIVSEKIRTAAEFDFDAYCTPESTPPLAAGVTDISPRLRKMIG